MVAEGKLSAGLLARNGLDQRIQGTQKGNANERPVSTPIGINVSGMRLFTSPLQGQSLPVMRLQDTNAFR